MFSAFSFIIEGTTEKVLQLIRPPVSIYYREDLINKKILMDITFAVKIFF